VPESRAPFHAALKRPEASEDNDTEDPSFKSLWRNSVCQVAQRSRGGGESPPSGAARPTKKIDNFLPRRLTSDIVFQKFRTRASCGRGAIRALAPGHEDGCK
jgi:hypothetical protein